MKKNAEFILGIDGGATKTIARLVHLDSNKSWQITLGPSSLTNDFQGAVNTLEEACSSLCYKANCTLDNVVGVFGLAGACNQANAEKLSRIFKERMSEFEICSDAKTSAYGANNGLPVATIALGTGSVGMRLESDGKYALIGGWGFLLGDDGGGAKLGLHAVQATMAEIQRLGHCISPLGIGISKRVGLTRTGILSWSAQATPIKFAQLAPLVFEHHKNCQMANSVMQTHLENVEQLICETRADTKLPVVLLGSLGEPTYHLLSESIQKVIVKAQGNALDGACLLARRNTQSNKQEVELNDYAG